MTWTCPRCDRPFQTRRAHVCEPGLPIPVWLDEREDGQRRAAEAVLAIAQKIKGLVIEAVTVGVFIKRAHSIVELRPRTKWLQLSIVTTDTIDSAKITREQTYGDSHIYYLRLRDKADVDAQVRGWIRAALR